MNSRIKLVRVIFFCIVVPLISAGVSAQTDKVDAVTHKAIVESLISKGELTEDCVRDRGGEGEVVGIDPVDLNRDGKPEFFVYGQGGCACAARRCYAWVYRKTATGFEMLLSAGPVEEISRKKTITKGYYDLKVIQPSANDGMAIITRKYNGRRYQ